MTKSCCALLAFVLVSTLASTAAAQQYFPLELGKQVPDAVSHSTREPMRCLTAEAHFDPCTIATVSSVRYVVGWDQSTFNMVYLFTDDPAFRAVKDLVVGRQMRVARSRLIPFKGWQIDPRSGSGGWLAVVVPLDLPLIVGEQDETTALIVGFVKTDYLSPRVVGQ